MCIYYMYISIYLYIHIYMLPAAHLLLVLRKHYGQTYFFGRFSAVRGASPFRPHGTAVRAGTLTRLAATGGSLACEATTLLRQWGLLQQKRLSKKLVKLEFGRCEN